MSIARKFTLALLACVVVVLAVQTAASVRDEDVRSEEGIESYQLATGAALRPAIAAEWRAEGRDRAIELVKEADQRLRNIDIRWVWLSPDAEPEHRPRVDVSRLGDVVAGQDITIVDRSYEGAGRIFTYSAMTKAERPPAAIEISQSLSKESAVRRSAAVRAALTAGGISVASALVTALLGTVFIARPLARLVEQARRVGAGDLSFRIGVNRKDEIAALAREMNRMCDGIEESRAHIVVQAEARTRAVEELRHAERLATVGRLAAGMAHELGTPLNIARARARRIATGELTPGDAAAKAQIIVDQVDRMTKLVRQLLELARKRELKREPVDLPALVGETVALLEPMARKRGVALGATHDEAAALSARVDRAQMSQVLTNLVVNAIHASQPGGRVSVSVAGEDAAPLSPHDGPPLRCVCMQVQDEGSGIPSEHVPRIFEPFFTTKDVGEGTGLGLSVAYGIVADHGGWISVDTVVGLGSRFVVHIPQEAAT